MNLDIKGKILFKEFNVGKQYTVDLTKYPSNIYFLRAFSDMGVVTKKLVIN